MPTSPRSTAKHTPLISRCSAIRRSKSDSKTPSRYWWAKTGRANRPCSRRSPYWRGSARAGAVMATARSIGRTFREAMAACWRTPFARPGCPKSVKAFSSAPRPSFRWHAMSIRPPMTLAPRGPIICHGRMARVFWGFSKNAPISRVSIFSTSPNRRSRRHASSNSSSCCAVSSARTTARSSWRLTRRF